MPESPPAGPRFRRQEISTLSRRPAQEVSADNLREFSYPHTIHNAGAVIPRNGGFSTGSSTVLSTVGRRSYALQPSGRPCRPRPGFVAGVRGRAERSPRGEGEPEGHADAGRPGVSRPAERRSRHPAGDGQPTAAAISMTRTGTQPRLVPQAGSRPEPRAGLLTQERQRIEYLQRSQVGQGNPRHK